MTALLIAAALVFTPGDAHLAYETARTLVYGHTPRNSGTPESRQAAEFIAAEAAKAGARATLDAFRAVSADEEREFANVVAELPRGNANDGWVVLVSHFDTKHGVDCPGANDGASTSGLLIGLAAAIARCEGFGGNVQLVWTDGEECVRCYCPEDGLQGSKRAAKALGQSGRKVLAVIVLDMLGDEDLSVSVPLNGTTWLRQLAVASAAAVGEPQLVRPTLGNVTDDHVPFLFRGMPAVDLIDFSYGPSNAYWHTAQDTMAHVGEKSLLKSGRLVAEMVNQILKGGVR